MKRTRFGYTCLACIEGLHNYNKRGIGGSEGKCHILDFFDRAVETQATLEFLKLQPEVDSTKPGLIGHSQGGWIVQ